MFKIQNQTQLIYSISIFLKSCRQFNLRCIFLFYSVVSRTTKKIEMKTKTVFVITVFPSQYFQKKFKNSMQSNVMHSLNNFTYIIILLLYCTSKIIYLHLKLSKPLVLFASFKRLMPLGTTKLAFYLSFHALVQIRICQPLYHILLKTNCMNIDLYNK